MKFNFGSLPTNPSSFLNSHHSRKPDIDKEIRLDWPIVRDQIIKKALRAKFLQHPPLKAQLLATGNKILIEKVEKEIADLESLQENKLGTLLMEVRDEIRALKWIDLSHDLYDNMPGPGMKNEDGMYCRLTAKIRPFLSHELTSKLDDSLNSSFEVNFFILFLFFFFQN